jgi:hypothetical protein
MKEGGGGEIEVINIELMVNCSKKSSYVYLRMMGKNG